VPPDLASLIAQERKAWINLKRIYKPCGRQRESAQIESQRNRMERTDVRGYEMN
jgi:hypothetical protein